MKINDIARQSLLYDFYGALLTKRQREVMELYHEENLSLAEIAEEFGISRQGVHDTLKNAHKALEGYEEKLGLMERFTKTSAAINEIDENIGQLIKECENSGRSQDATRLRHIRAVIDKLED